MLYDESLAVAVSVAYTGIDSVRGWKRFERRLNSLIESHPGVLWSALSGVPSGIVGGLSDKASRLAHVKMCNVHLAVSVGYIMYMPRHRSLLADENTDRRKLLIVAAELREAIRANSREGTSSMISAVLQS